MLSVADSLGYGANGGVQIVDAGMVDNPVGALEVALLFAAEQVDLVFLYMATSYFPSVRSLTGPFCSWAGLTLIIGNTNSFSCGAPRFIEARSAAGPSHLAPLELSIGGGTLRKVAFLLGIPLIK